MAEEQLMSCTLDGSTIITDKAVYVAEAMTDDDVDRFIADPALIQTHEQALDIIDVLDGEIANIQAQVDGAQIEANVRPLSHDRQQWLQRAAYACAMRRNDRHKVMQRDKEIRGIKLWGGNPPDPTKKEANLLKQQRLADEVAIRRAAKQVDLLRLQNEREALAQKRREFHADQTISNLRNRLRDCETSLNIFDEGRVSEYWMRHGDNQQ